MIVSLKENLEQGLILSFQLQGSLSSIISYSESPEPVSAGMILERPNTKMCGASQAPRGQQVGLGKA